MIAGTKNNVLTAMDEVREGEPCFVFLGRNPLAAETLRYFYKRCLSSGKLEQGELETIKGWVEKFEQYQPQSESLLAPKESLKKESDALPPRPEPEVPETEESPVTEDFDEDRKQEEEEPESEEDTSKEDTSEEEDKPSADDAIDNL